MDIRNLEVIEAQNKIKNTENGLRMEKEDHDKADQENRRIRGMVEQAQLANKALQMEILDL
jgi:ribosomal protein L30/L7E